MGQGVQLVGRESRRLNENDINHGLQFLEQVLRRHKQGYGASGGHCDSAVSKQGQNPLRSMSHIPHPILLELILALASSQCLSSPCLWASKGS